MEGDGLAGTGEAGNDLQCDTHGARGWVLGVWVIRTIVDEFRLL
jgi:hypothetical protein